MSLQYPEEVFNVKEYYEGRSQSSIRGLLMLLLWRIINNNNTASLCLLDSFAVGTAACTHFANCIMFCLSLICCRADIHVLFICCTRLTPADQPRFPTLLESSRRANHRAAASPVASEYQPPGNGMLENYVLLTQFFSLDNISQEKYEVFNSRKQDACSRLFRL